MSPPGEARPMSPPSEAQPASPGGDAKMADAAAAPAAAAPAGEAGAAAGPGPSSAGAAGTAPAPVMREVYRIPASASWFTWEGISQVEKEGGWSGPVGGQPALEGRGRRHSCACNWRRRDTPCYGYPPLNRLGERDGWRCGPAAPCCVMRELCIRFSAHARAAPPTRPPTLPPARSSPAPGCPEFFDGKSESKTPGKYREIRNLLINKYRYEGGEALLGQYRAVPGTKGAGWGGQGALLHPCACGGAVGEAAGREVQDGIMAGCLPK